MRETFSRQDVAAAWPIVLLEEAAAGNEQRSSTMDITELEIPKLGEFFYIGALDGPVNLSDIASVTMALTTRINQSINRILDSMGIASPCRKGCTKCCHLLVLLSAPEAIHLVEGVMTKIPNRQREYLIESCDKHRAWMRERLPEHIIPKHAHNISESELRSISNWYRRQKQPCAFLENGLCTIYDHRPIACRAFTVVGPAGQCQLDGITKVKQVTQRPLYLTHVLGRLVSELEHARRTGIFLHDVFAWYMENEELRNRTWPATMVVERFVDIVKSTVQKNSTLTGSASMRS
jgi:Fe-S-cluster containining protein